MKGWTTAFKKGAFSQKLKEAQHNLKENRQKE
jgi:hypothetical protein